MESLPLLGAGVLAWAAAYAALRCLILRERSHDFCNRLVSLIHVFVALLLCSLSIQDWSQPFRPLASRATQEQLRAIGVSLAYFIYDLFCCCILDNPFDLANAMHHIVSISGLAYGFATGLSGTELVGCLWLMEMSNPFMHARELLKQLGFKDTKLNLWNDLLFVLTFTVARMGFGPYLTFVTLRADNPLPVKAGASGIQIVSVFWFFKIAKLAYFKFAKKKKSE